MTNNRVHMTFFPIQSVKKRRWMSARFFLIGLLGSFPLTMLGGCNDLTGTQSFPSGTQDPSYYNSVTGALGMRNATDSLFQTTFLQYIIDSGLLTDELEDPNTGASLGATAVVDPLDERILPEGLTGSGSDGHKSYEDLQRVRGHANLAIGALAVYDSTASPALRGEMYALQGYADILLADLFCSGVPLSTLDFNGDFTYHTSATTQQIYADAIAKFDTALTLSGDSVRIQNLARVGKGRALLDMDSTIAAAKAVEAVPDGFQYQLSVGWFFNAVSGQSNNLLNTHATVSDREGGNGLPFISSNDPRTTNTNSGTTLTGLQLTFPNKYAAGLTGYGPVTVADWIEARLIRAEVALSRGDDATWLSQLNYLRQHATISGQMSTPLDPLTDPGTDSTRVSLLFQERAYWLYLTGHRQGDLRRLIREYGWDQSDVYPKGNYLAPGQGVYGTDVTVPIPSTEVPNPLFHGCLDRDA